METLGTGAAKLNLLFQIGSARSIKFNFGQDISSWTFEFILKKFKGDRVKTIYLTLGSGISFPVYETDEIDVTFSTSNTSIEEGEYFWELRKLNSNIPLLNGNAYFSFDAPEGTTSSSTVQVSVSGQTVNVTISGVLPVSDFNGVTLTSTATLTPDFETYDGYEITAQATALAIAAPTGSVANWEGKVLRITDNGTGRAISWNAIYRPFGSALPTTTVLGKTLYIPMVYNSTDTKWDVLPSQEEQ